MKILDISKFGGECLHTEIFKDNIESEEIPNIAELKNGVYRAYYYAWVFELEDGRKFRPTYGIKRSKKMTTLTDYSVVNGEIRELKCVAESFGIRKVSIDDVRIKDTNIVFPKSGKTLKESLETGMVVQLANKQFAIYIDHNLANNIKINSQNGIIAWVDYDGVPRWIDLDKYDYDLKINVRTTINQILFDIEKIWKVNLDTMAKLQKLCDGSTHFSHDSFINKLDDIMSKILNNIITNINNKNNDMVLWTR